MRLKWDLTVSEIKEISYDPEENGFLVSLLSGTIYGLRSKDNAFTEAAAEAILDEALKMGYLNLSSSLWKRELIYLHPY